MKRCFYALACVLALSVTAFARPCKIAVRTPQTNACAMQTAEKPRVFPLFQRLRERVRELPSLPVPILVPRLIVSGCERGICPAK